MPDTPPQTAGGFLGDILGRALHGPSIFTAPIPLPGQTASAPKPFGSFAPTPLAQSESASPVTGGMVPGAGYAALGVSPPANSFNAAKKDLGLNEQEQNLYNYHLQNLGGSGKVNNPDGSISTIYQAVVPGPDGKFYNIPTVRNGHILPVPQAAQAAAADGWSKWPSYSTPEEADARYEKMHNYMGEDVQRYLQSQGQGSSQQ